MKTKVYLSGGMWSGWQERVISELGTEYFEFYNPANHNLKEPIHYTYWDLFYAKKADIMFAYMEKDNPSGFGLALEIGYAKALGKLIILVDEKSGTDEAFKNKFNIVRCSSNVVFNNLEDAIMYLDRYKG
jgi:nucleoside 2-deoxyribosyltransferase